MKNILLWVTCILLAGNLNAQNFGDYFVNKTLRIDYVLSGNSNKQDVYLDELSQLPTWAGRHNHLSEVPLAGNGQIEMKDQTTGAVIYKTSFSTLFQEWLTTDEAKHVSRSYEHSILLPYPIHPAEINVMLRDSMGNFVSCLKHLIKPDDILIHKRGISNITPHKYLIESGNPEECIDVAILAEGYTKEEMATFYQDAQIACESIFSHEPFKSMQKKFNIVAVESESKDSGVSVPAKGEWKNTAFNSHFNTFYSDRYLTTSRVKDIHNVLAGIPYEHIIILANTEQYGGGGIYNSFTLTTAHHPKFRPVVVHEFGHSFGGLADEYFYEEDLFSDTYSFNIEPWEPNITTRVDFHSKWEDMLKSKTPIPTDPKLAEKYPVGLYEGGGYSAKGIYRPADDCRMRTNTAPAFCPVCQRAIEKMINYYTK